MQRPGVLMLTGNDTLANYQHVLDSITYISTSSNPTDSGNDPTRTISWVVNDGTLDSATQTTTLNITASTVTIPAGSTTTLNGGILQASFIDVEGTLTGFGTIIADVIENNGTIAAKSSHTLTIEISGSITGTGTLEITNNTTLTLDGPVGPGQTVLFDIGGGSVGKLVLADPSEFQGQISGFRGSDQIDLTTITFDSGTTWAYFDNGIAGDNTGGTLIISETVNGVTTQVASVTFSTGDYTTANFKLSSDGTGGILIADPPADASTTTAAGSTTTADASTATPVAPTTTADVTLIPVASTSTLPATKTTSSQTKATSATVTQTASSRANGIAAAAAADEAIMIALSTAVAVAVSAVASDADADETSPSAISGSDTAVNPSTASGSDSFTLNSDAALKPPDGMVGTLSENATVEVLDGKLQIADIVSETGASKLDAGAAPQPDGSDAVNGLFITHGRHADAIEFPGNHTTKTAWQASDDGRGGKSAPASESTEDISAQSASANDHFSVSGPFTEAPSGHEHAGSTFKPSVEHAATVDPEIQLRSLPEDQLLQHPRDNLIDIHAQSDHEADPAHPHVDGNQSADDGDAPHVAALSDLPTLTVPAHGRIDGSEWASPNFADTPQSARSTSEDTLAWAPAAHGSHGNADPKNNDIADGLPPQHAADQSLRVQHDDNGSPPLIGGIHPGHHQLDSTEPISSASVDNGSPHLAHATGGAPSVPPTPPVNGHQSNANPEINLASIAPNQPPEHPGGNLPPTAAQPEDGPHPADPPVDVNKVPSFKFADSASDHDPGPEGAHPAHPQVDGAPSDSFKFADGGDHPGTILSNPPTAPTPLSSDLSGTHASAAPTLAATFDVPAVGIPAPDQFIFAEKARHDPVADQKPDVIENDRSLPRDVQQLVDIAHETDPASTPDPHHAITPQDTPNVQAPHYHDAFHLA
jgi:hypothetical protein